MTEQPEQHRRDRDAAPEEQEQEAGPPQEQEAGELSDRAAKNQARQSRRADRPDTVDADRAAEDEAVP